MFSMENTFGAMRLILFGKRKTPSSPSTARCFRRFGVSGGLVVPAVWWYRYFGGTGTLQVISATSPPGLDF